MILKIKEKEKLKTGDIKIVTKFAIFPTRIDSDTIIWLEKYYIKYKLEDKRYFDYDGCLCINRYWTEINRYIDER